MIAVKATARPATPFIKKRERSDSIHYPPLLMMPKTISKRLAPIPILPFDYESPRKIVRPGTPLPIERNKYNDEDWDMLLATQREDSERFDALVKRASEIKLRDGVDFACAYLIEEERKGIDI